MLFNSFEFLIFFPIVTALYFLLPFKYKWAMLLAASCVFYMFFIPVYISILAVTIVIDYAAGKWIEDSQGAKRKYFLIMSIISTCLVLFVFKYFNFFNESFRAIAVFLHLNYPIGILNVILPIGLSFHTFQSLSYVIEVYRGKQKAERNFGIYSLYVMFYPQLVAGPIERPQNLIHQFHEDHPFDWQRVKDGIKLMAWGMFKKVVIADRLAIVVNHVYASPNDYSGIYLLLATVFFAFQIYCDFSGYSDIAIGSAQVMGFKLMDNFNRPYFSKSIAEFWKRWHISLSTWFRDYLYISLGGNRVSKPRWYFNLFITFLISGLWHGANWTFVIWGALNGFYLVFSIWTEGIRKNVSGVTGLAAHPKLHKYFKVGVTFALTCFAWIFFRAKSLPDALNIIGRIFTEFGGALDIKRLGVRPYEFVIALAAIAFLEAVHLVQRHGEIRHMLKSQPVFVRWGIYYAILFGILMFGEFNLTQFIYFQF